MAGRALPCQAIAANLRHADATSLDPTASVQGQDSFRNLARNMPGQQPVLMMNSDKMGFNFSILSYLC